MSRISVIVPTLNSEISWIEWINAAKDQLGLAFEVLVVDSSSTDNTVPMAVAAGFKVRVIERAAFNHGGTRQAALGDLSPSCGIVVYLTQDAILASPQSLVKLVEAFDDPKVGAAYGRQLPHHGAGSIAAHARFFNYPAMSHVTTPSNMRGRGIKATFLSNSFAAYRIDALNAVGGFPVNTILSEDAYVGAKMLLAGWSIAYVANAQVRHSHDYSLWQEFKRYFDIGVFHSREGWIRREFGVAEGEGLRFVVSEMRYLARHAPWLIPSAWLRALFKYLAYKLGALERWFPLNIKRRISMHRQYWRHTENTN